MSSGNSADSEDKVPSNSVKEDIKMQFDREVEALRNHLMEANGAAHRLSHLLGGNPEYRTATSTKAISQLRKLFRKAANEVADLENSMLIVLDQKCGEQAAAIVAEKENGDVREICEGSITLR